jgi:O-antigen ligase
MSKLSSYFAEKDAIWKFIIRLGLILVLFAPLIIYNDSYFPFVFPRNIFFRLIIDLIFPIYLWLVIKNAYQWPKFNRGFIFFVLFILILTISSIFGGNFLFSFWSSFERMDGLVNWYHILMYVIVLLGVNRSEKDWLLLFKVSIFVAWVIALYAVGQAMNLSFLIPSSGGQRLASLMGNAAYVGSYLFLHIVLSVYFIIKKAQKKDFFSWGVFYYALSIILFIAILLATETRGAFLGLLVFAFLMAVAYLFYERHKKNIYYYVVAALIISGFIGIFLIFAQKNSSFVKSVPILSRIAGISLTDTTTQSRLMIWKNSLYAFKEKPLIGWGEENFSNAFNKYFPSEIFVTMGSEIWYDRPHNILVQHLVQGGLVGLGLYLAIFIYLLLVLKNRRRQDGDWPRQVLWSAFLVGFLVQDFFIFDNLNVNVVFYLILAYLFSLTLVSTDIKSRFVVWFTHWQNKLHDKKFNLAIRGVFLAMLAMALVYFMVWKPWQSNTVFVKTFYYAPRAKTVDDFQKVKSDWLRSYYLVPLGDKEKIAALNDVLGLVIGNPKATDEIRFEFINLTGQYLESNYEKYPMDIRSGMFLSNFYQFVGTFDPSFIDQDIALLERMAKLAPQRLEIKFALQKNYQRKGDLQKAKEQVWLAIDLAPNSRDVYWKLTEVYWQAKEYDDFANVVKKMRDWNHNFGEDNFTPAQITDLNNYLQQVKTSKQKDLVIMLEAFLKE